MESERENAPFKPSPDDEISLDMHRKKTGKETSHRQHPRYSDQSEEERALLLNTNKAAKDTKDVWLQGNKSFADLGTGGFDCSLIRQDSVAQYRRRLTNRQQLSQVDEDARRGMTESEELGFVDALQFARASSIHRKRGESLVGATARPLASLINAVCISSESALSPEQAKLQSFSFAPTQKQRKPSWNTTPRSRKKRRPTHKSQETPASITLRKASQASNVGYDTRSKPIANRFFGLYQPSGTSQPPNSFSQNHQVKFDLSIPSHDTLPVRPQRLSSVAGPQLTPSCLDLLGAHEESAYPRWKRHSVTADFALTYTDVQPTLFPCSNSPGQQALVAMGGHRKPSRSKVQTRSSVHEIIWAKDDSPNSAASYNFDLIKSASLSPVTDRGSVGQGSLSVPTSSVQALQKVFPPKSATFPRAISEDIGPINDSSPHRAFSGWSWQPDTIRESLKTGRNQGLDNISSKGFDSQPASLPELKVQVESAMSGLDTVESFPPLLNRKRTLDWQRLPLVDLNDPRAGREEDDAREGHDTLCREIKGKVPIPTVSLPDTTEEQDPFSTLEPKVMATPELSHGRNPGPAAVRLAHARQSISSIQPRRASSNIGISKASRIAKHRRSISDGAIPDVAALLAQASRIVKNSLSAFPNEDESLSRPSKVPTRKAKSVQSLSSSDEAPILITTQDPSVRLVEVAGADEGEGEDVGCLVTNASRNQSRLSLSLG